ncbi:MAG TPA: hypothetical protein VHK88_01940, partial [Aquihabitans sp.]|nr:hypothetical protein [Aquihabitans sp.]
MRQRRIWVLGVVAVLVGVFPAALGEVAGAQAPSTSCTIYWQASGPDALWSNPANWAPVSGPPRVPGAGDAVCSDAARRGVVDSPFSVSRVQGSNVTIRSSLTSLEPVDFDDLVMDGGGSLSSPHVSTSTFSAVGGPGPSVLRSGALTVHDAVSVNAPLEASGYLDLQGPVAIGGAGVLHLVGEYDPAFRWALTFHDEVSVAGPGSLVAAPGYVVETRPTARWIGPPPTFPDATVSHRGPFEVRVTGDSQVSNVAAGATIRVVPGAAGSTELEGTEESPNVGRIILDGMPSDRVVAEFQGNNAGQFVNAGTLTMDHATLAGPFDNRGVVRLEAGAVVERVHSSFFFPTRNTGYVLVGGAPDPGTKRASAQIDGELVNTGAILPATPPGELVLPENRTALGGVVTAPLRLRDGALVAEPGYRGRIGDLTVEGGAVVANQVAGRSVERSGVVASTGRVTLAPDALVATDFKRP